MRTNSVKVQYISRERMWMIVIDCGYTTFRTGYLLSRRRVVILIGNESISMRINDIRSGLSTRIRIMRNFQTILWTNSDVLTQLDIPQTRARQAGQASHKQGNACYRGPAYLDGNPPKGHGQWHRQHAKEDEKRDQKPRISYQLLVHCLCTLDMSLILLRTPVFQSLSSAA